MLLRIHLVMCIYWMHVKADCHIPKIECRTNQTVCCTNWLRKWHQIYLVLKSFTVNFYGLEYLMFLRIHLVECINRMHAKAGFHTSKIECRTNQTVLLHKFIAKMASKLPCVQKFRNKFSADGVPDFFAHSFG